MNPNARPSYEFGPFRLDPSEHLVLVPQFRVVGGSGRIRLQPGVSLRWRP